MLLIEQTYCVMLEVAEPSNRGSLPEGQAKKMEPEGQDTPLYRLRSALSRFFARSPVPSEPKINFGMSPA